MTIPTHQALQTKDCLPAVHIVDCGYMSAQAIVTGQRDYEIDLLGPIRSDTGWQAREDQGFSLYDFVIGRRSGPLARLVKPVCTGCLR